METRGTWDIYLGMDHGLAFAILVNPSQVSDHIYGYANFNRQSAPSIKVTATLLVY